MDRVIVASVLSCIALVVSPSMAAVDCSDPYQFSSVGCCVTFSDGDSSCTPDNPDLVFEWLGIPANADFQNLAACSWDQCTPYCETLGGTYVDDNGQEQPLMRWNSPARYSDDPTWECRCQETDPALGNTDPGNPLDCIVPLDDPDLVINEIDYVQPGITETDFVEILNLGPSPVHLGRYSLELVYAGSPGHVFRVVELPEIALASGEYLVVCDDPLEVVNCDFVVPGPNFLPVAPACNGCPGYVPRAVALVRGAHVVDAITYGSGSPFDSLDSAYTEGMAAGLDESTQAYASLSRFPNGIDTDDNSVDFALKCASPGRPNSSAVSDCKKPPEITILNVDIKPAGYPNSVNPRSRGVIPVAILGSDSFDVATIDEATLRFGPDGAPIAHRHAHFEDVNLDGIIDLVTHYRVRDTGIACGDTSAALSGAFTTRAPCIDFIPSNPLPGSNEVTAQKGLGSDCETAVIDVMVSQVANLYGAAFDATYPTDLGSFGQASGEDSVLASDGAEVSMLTAETGPGELVVGIARLGTASGIDVADGLLVRLSFDVIGATGTGVLDFTNTYLLDANAPPQSIPGISWFGGVVTVEETTVSNFFEASDSINTVGCRETRQPAIWMKDHDRLGKPRGDGPVNIERD